VREVLATCVVVAQQTPQALGSYVISMASKPSDVLNVILLLREAGMKFPMRVVPLFETLSDLQGVPDSMAALYEVDWSRDYCQGRQEVVAGSSESSADAGQLMAAWTKYQAQQQPTQVAIRHGVHLTLLHGRGGGLGRAGGRHSRVTPA